MRSLYGTPAAAAIFFDKGSVKDCSAFQAGPYDILLPTCISKHLLKHTDAHSVIPGLSATRKLSDQGLAVAVGTIIADGPRTDPYERVYAYGSYEG